MFLERRQFHLHQLFLVTSSSKEEKKRSAENWLDTKDYLRMEQGERSFDTAF